MKYKLPKLRHIVALNKYGYNFKEFLLIKEDLREYVFVNIQTGNRVSIKKEDCEWIKDGGVIKDKSTKVQI